MYPIFHGFNLAPMFFISYAEVAQRGIERFSDDKVSGKNWIDSMSERQIVTGLIEQYLVLRDKHNRVIWVLLYGSLFSGVALLIIALREIKKAETEATKK